MVRREATGPDGMGDGRRGGVEMAETITAEQAAKRLGITTRTLWRWVDAGKIRDAPRTGNYRMFYAKDVDALLYETKGIPTVADLTVFDVYKRLMEADTWEDVDALRSDMEAAICAHAENKGPLEDAYRAATSMAATHPREDARERWARTAREYGMWLGITAEDTDRAIRHKGRKGSYVTYESARAELEAAPRNPAYVIAGGQAVAERSTSQNSDCGK